MAKWTETYLPPGRPVVAVHRGGPADGQEIQLGVTRPPPARYYAAQDARGEKWVNLARYVLAQPLGLTVFEYAFAGLSTLTGPVPGTDSTGTWS